MNSTNIYYYGNLEQVQKVETSSWKVKHELDGKNHSANRRQREQSYVDASFKKEHVWKTLNKESDYN